ncbi:MAG: hypothetical protein Q8R48_01480, partial [Candidatus Omnitrophota bacterium]|nr:hypothetical protein [Candidatus Omnitrophota bacterium]
RGIRNVWPSSHYGLLSLFFFAGLELSLALQRWIFLVISILLAIIVIGIILVRAEEGSRFHPTQVILPALAAFSLTAFTLFLPTTLLLHSYIVGASLFFFFLLKHAAKQAYPTWNWVVTLLVLFAGTASLLGWRFHIYAPPAVVIGILYFFITLLSLQSLLRFTESISESWLISLVVGLVLIEVAWVLQFLSVHFLVQAGIVTALYYSLFQLTTLSYEREIYRTDIVEYISIGLGTCVILLLTAQWF